jgi:hypothetical protein
MPCKYKFHNEIYLFTLRVSVKIQTVWPGQGNLDWNQQLTSGQLASS